MYLNLSVFLSGISSRIGSICGATAVNDEVAVILKVEIHAVIEAGVG